MKQPINVNDIEWNENPKGQLIPNVDIFDIVYKDEKFNMYMVHAIWASGFIQCVKVGNRERMWINPLKHGKEKVEIYKY